MNIAYEMRMNHRRNAVQAIHYGDFDGINSEAVEFGHMYNWEVLWWEDSSNGQMEDLYDPYGDEWYLVSPIELDDTDDTGDIPF